MSEVCYVECDKPSAGIWRSSHQGWRPRVEWYWVSRPSSFSFRLTNIVYIVCRKTPIIYLWRWRENNIGFNIEMRLLFVSQSFPCIHGKRLTEFDLVAWGIEDVPAARRGSEGGCWPRMDCAAVSSFTGNTPGSYPSVVRVWGSHLTLHQCWYSNRLIM